MKIFRRNRGIALFILNFGNRWRLVVNFTPPGRFTLRKRTPISLNKRLGGYPSRPGCFEEEKQLLLLPGFEPRIVQPVA
jgi:hypothetical protein